ncbi:MAG: hypothetical protein B6244_11460 [Candidatus Cloacimonetes bacterium 4572_55]|nr:MAG: hypothetical protein B6244_11460 [Candidatus Cloacimonetes bacterium 4572_55]
MGKSEKYHVRSLKASEMRAWETLVSDQTTSRSAFDSVLWLQANARIFPNNDVEAYGVFHKDRQVAGLTAYVRRRGPLRVVAAPIMSFYHSLALPDYPTSYRRTLNRHEQLHALLPALESRFDSIELRLDPSIRDIRPFIWRGWEIRVSYTYRLSLDSDQAVQIGFNRNFRKLIRRGEDAGLTAIPCRDIEGIVHLHRKVYDAQQIAPPLTDRQMEKLLTDIFSSNLAEGWGAYDPEGKLVAVDVTIQDNKRAYMFLSASDPDRRQTGASAFLRRHLFRQLRERMPEVDLTGADISRVARFKSSMGGELIPYYRVKKHTTALGKFTMGAYEFSHTLRSKILRIF